MNSKLVCFFALIATAFAAPEYIYPSGLPAHAPFAAVSSLGPIARFGSYNPYVPYSPYFGGYASFAPAPIETAPIENVRTLAPITKTAPVTTEVAAPISSFNLAPASHFLPYARIAPAAPIAPVATEVAAPISPFGLAPTSSYLPYARIAPHPFTSAYSFLKTIEAKKYPEGVDSSKCPNYPFCDHPELPSIDLTIPESPVHTEPQIPADVVGCPNYPVCDTPEIPAIDASIPPLPMHTEPQIPANVDPAKCPNYPLCDVSDPIVVESA